MGSLSPELRKLIARIAKENDIVNYTEEIFNNVAKEGDGYMGILEALNIADKDNDNQLSLVIKRAPTSEALRKQFPTRIIFVREIYFYHEVVPALKSFQERHSISSPFTNIAKIYGFIEDEFKEVLLLQNLKSDGYNTCDRREPMDSHHLTLGLTTYAKLHATTLAMRRLEPETFKKTTANIMTHIMVDFVGSKMENPAQNTDMLGAFFLPTLAAVKDNEKLTQAIERAKEHVPRNVFKEIFDPTDEEFTVLAHADCWSTNLMFKYQDPSNPNIPTDVKLIDWQTSHVTNPMFDVTYFLLINAAKPDLENYQKYLEIYYEALSQNLSAFGLDVGSVYPFELLQEHWRKFAPIGFHMCILMLHQSLSDSKTHDFEQMAADGRDLFDLASRDIIISDRFKQRMSDLVEFLDNNQLI
ncbi:uncharacterized protein LOC109544968 [Dendroctonus ponderosae]|uniref:uncharacterized protein LOC109544968 n=1 Tax=Dendroctonus ponderosae TaxID=77166 RepID=UPI002035BEDD|nr:uncharacterized protein LOC109544968 [Dendroctonus ponderosae]KAH1028092.1 hypothetical protein HUJ05_001489 [Dendroctonus ponderosae]